MRNQAKCVFHMVLKRIEVVWQQLSLHDAYDQIPYIAGSNSFFIKINVRGFGNKLFICSCIFLLLKF